MNKIAVIGATGKLGKELMKHNDAIECPVRFQNSDEFVTWFEIHKEIDTVWHVARACRKNGIRRDFSTFMLEYNAMQKLLSSRASDCRFVYASTKVVYGVTGGDVDPRSVEFVSRYFMDSDIGTVNCPNHKKTNLVDTTQLGKEHLIYAMTKLACERLIRAKCQNYKILRIWDII